jgi:fluoride ion exporter CrcB/FEX
VISLLQRGAWLSGLGLALAHVVISLALCAVGIYLFKALS